MQLAQPAVRAGVLGCSGWARSGGPGSPSYPEYSVAGSLRNTRYTVASPTLNWLARVAMVSPRA
jgi:hypothetical protein